jgi:hypothetical protein
MRYYSAQFNGVAVTAQQDFFEVLAATGKPVVITKIELEQTTETGDAQEEGLSILFKRGAGSVTSGSGGSSPTPTPADVDDSAAGATVEVNNTTKMVTGSGTITTLAAWAWNVRMPFNKIFLPEERIIVKPGDRVTVELGTTPADSITMNGTIWFYEIG